MKVMTIMATTNLDNKEGEDDEKCDEKDDSGSDKYFSPVMMVEQNLVKVMKKTMMAVRAKRLNMNRGDFDNELDSLGRSADCHQKRHAPCRHQ